jgi:hypothetical protein
MQADAKIMCGQTEVGEHDDEQVGAVSGTVQDRVNSNTVEDLQDLSTDEQT